MRWIGAASNWRWSYRERFAVARRRSVTPPKQRLSLSALFHDPNLERIRNRIAGGIWEFCRQVDIGGEFHMSDLEAYVQRYMIERRRRPVTPGSPGRIFRDLADNKGAIRYELLDKGKSHYRIVWLDESKL